jgi:hypothetical protein
MVNTESSPRQTRKVVAFLVKVYGFLFSLALTGTVISLICVNDLLANAARVNGEVIDITYGTKGTRAPVVRFKTAKGEIFQLTSDVYTSPAPNVGDVVKVVYRTSNPRDWRIDDWIHLYFWTLMGLIFMFAWAIAITITTVVGHYHFVRLERAAAKKIQEGL